jgi:phage terminase small subunit
MKFVAAVAGGKTQTAAYKEAGYATNGKPRTAVRNARQLAQNAEVRAAIEKMQLQLLPDPGDVRVLRAHAMGVIVRLSLEAEEEKVKLAAATWLHEETGKQIAERERLARSQERPKRESVQEIIAELRMLYAKALPDREPPLLETVGEAPGEE